MKLYCTQCGAPNDLFPGASGKCVKCGADLAPPSTAAGQPAPFAAPKNSALAIASLVCGILTPCMLLLGLVSIGLGIGALVSISRQPAVLKGKGLAIGGIVASVVWTVLLAALAIPNFIKFQERSRNSEARRNLKALATSEQALFATEGKFVAFGPTPAPAPGERVSIETSQIPGELGWTPSEPVYFQYVAETEGTGDQAAVVIHARRVSQGSPIEYQVRVSPGGTGEITGGEPGT